MCCPVVEDRVGTIEWGLTGPFLAAVTIQLNATPPLQQHHPLQLLQPDEALLPPRPQYAINTRLSWAKSHPPSNSVTSVITTR